MKVSAFCSTQPFVTHSDPLAVHKLCQKMQTQSDKGMFIATRVTWCGNDIFVSTKLTNAHPFT